MICKKCNKPEIPYYHNRCHSCYLILRRTWYHKNKPVYKSAKQKYRQTGHPVWVRELLNTIKRSRSKNRPEINQYEPSKEELKKLAIKLSEKLLNTAVCPYTGEKLVLGQNVSLDHKIPISKRPDLAYTYNNLQWVSKTYNRHKSDMTDKEFLNFCRNLLNRLPSGN